MKNRILTSVMATFMLLFISFSGNAQTKKTTPAKKAAAKKPAKAAAAPAAVAAPVAQTALNPQAAWPFPTGTKP